MKNKTNLSPEYKLILILASLKLIIHLFANAFLNYGIFRDELYYVACSNRLDLGYVDQPPLSLYILAVTKFIIGDSLFALRLLPAIASALIVYFTGLITLRMGGGKVAVLIACISIMAAPIYWAMFTFYSMNAFDILLWTIGYYVLVLFIQNEDLSKNKKYWLILGLIIGLGSLNKISFLWFGFGLFIGLLLTNKRKQLLTIYLYIAALIAFVIFLPFIIWNITHNFAHLEFIRNASNLKYSSLNPVVFFVEQWRMLNIVAPPVYLLGLYFLMFNKEGRKFRLAGFVYVVTLVILIINWHSKPEYMAPAYTILFAGGGIFIERLFGERFVIWSKYVVPAILITFGLISLPFSMPVLPVPQYIRYAVFMGQKPSTSEHNELSELPQFYADMFGWEELAQTVSRVYTSLPKEEQKNTVAFALNYGNAGAIEYFSKKYQLPKVVCPHNSYWWWGKEDLVKNHLNPSVLIMLGGEREDYLKYFDEVSKAAVFKNRYAMPYENKTIFLCRKPKTPLYKAWDKVRFYI